AGAVWPGGPGLPACTDPDSVRGALGPGAGATAATTLTAASTSWWRVLTWPGIAAALVALLWTYDGWYGLTFSAGEVRDPERNVRRGLVAGTVIVIALYALAMSAYVRALPVATLAGSPRAAEATARALRGPVAAPRVAA